MEISAKESAKKYHLALMWLGEGELQLQSQQMVEHAVET